MLDSRLTQLCLCLTAAALALSAVAGEAPLPFPPGEKLTYSVRIWLGDEQLGMDVGTADFTVDRVELDGKPAYQFQIAAKGGAFGYKVQSTLTSLVDAASLKNIRYSEDHRGSEKKQRRLEFSDTAVSYWRLDRVELPDGKKSDERQWQCRKTMPVDHPFHDMLSALYLARAFDLSEAAPEQFIDVADTKNLWRLKATGGPETKLAVPAGTFAAVPVSFKSDILDADPKDTKFAGLFGMKGDLRIWVDSRTHAIVRIRGEIPLGIVLKVDVSLLKIGSAGSDAPKPPA